MPLPWVLKDITSLTGTKYGCGIAQCGACTVHIGGVATRSGVTAIGAARGDAAAIEGLYRARVRRWPSRRPDPDCRTRRFPPYSRHAGAGRRRQGGECVPVSDYRTALVTGASSGIGEATVRALAGRGIAVTALARRRDRLDALAAETGCETICLDLRDRDRLHAALDSRETDIVVNNAGTGLGMAGLVEAELDHIDAIAETNMAAALHVIRAVVPGMVARKRGHVVNIGSVAGLHPVRSALYGATKGAIHSLSQTLRLELLGSGVRVTEICPGRVRTQFFAAGYDDKDEARRVTHGFALLEAADIADAVMYALDAPWWVNVATIEIVPTEQAFGGLKIAPVGDYTKRRQI